MFSATLLLLVQSELPAVTPVATAEFHLPPIERNALHEAARRGDRFLATRRSPDGSFRPVARAQVCPVALTSLALWAACSTEGAASRRSELRTSVDHLLLNRRAGGGIYAPERGLAVYTSGVAAQALHAYNKLFHEADLNDVIAELDLFVYRNPTVESLVEAENDPQARAGDVADKARKVLEEKVLSGPERAAAGFLARTTLDARPGLTARARSPEYKPSGASTIGFGYEDVLPFVYRPIGADHQITLRALAAIRRQYTLERNPDLTRRYGDAGFQPGTQGLYYYYLLVARALSVMGSPALTLADGTTRDWPRDLARRLIALQRHDGSWSNADGSWWEDEPVLVTAYAMLALNLCADVGKPVLEAR